MMSLLEVSLIMLPIPRKTSIIDVNRHFKPNLPTAGAWLFAVCRSLFADCGRNAFYNSVRFDIHTIPVITGREHG